MLLLVTVCVERGFAVNYKLLLNSTNFFISKPSYTDTLLLSYQHYFVCTSKIRLKNVRTLLNYDSGFE